MTTFVLSNPSHQHTEVMYWREGATRPERVRIPMRETIDFNVSDEERDVVFKQVDGQCRALGLTVSER